MQFTEHHPSNARFIRSVGHSRIVVDDDTFQHSVVIFGVDVAPWDVSSVEQISSDHIAALMQHDPEILIVGTGAQCVFPKPEVFVPVRDARAGFEVMSTDAACRTYNVLVSEQRRALAALIVA